MKLRPTLAALFLVAAVGSARAQAIDTVSPASGSPGQLLTIDGSVLLGAGGVAKPKVFLRDPATLKKTALVVTAFSTTEITATFNGSAPGVRDVVVLPAGSAEIVKAGGFEVKRPVFGAVDSGNAQPDHASPGAQVTVNGSLFGTLKGSLLLGGKKTKVVSWADDAVVFTMPAKLTSGFYSIEVKNKVGSAVVSFALVVTGGAAGAKPADTLTATVGAAKFTLGKIFGLPEVFTTFLNPPDPPLPQVPMVIINATGPAVVGQPSKSIAVNIPFDTGLDAAQPLLAGDANGSVSYTELVGLFTSTVWDSTADDNYSIVVLSFTGNQFVGTFAGTLAFDAATSTSSPPPNTTVVVKKGKFRGTLSG